MAPCYLLRFFATQVMRVMAERLRWPKLAAPGMQANRRETPVMGFAR